VLNDAVSETSEVAGWGGRRSYLVDDHVAVAGAVATTSGRCWWALAKTYGGRAWTPPGRWAGPRSGESVDPASDPAAVHRKFAFTIV